MKDFQMCIRDRHPFLEEVIINLPYFMRIEIAAGNEKLDMIRSDIRAVSYTHLDVYKRQGFDGVQHTHLIKLRNKVSNKVVTVVCR